MKNGWFKKGVAIFIAILMLLSVLIPLINVYSLSPNYIMVPGTGDRIIKWVLIALAIAAVVVLICVLIPVIGKKKKK